MLLIRKLTNLLISLMIKKVLVKVGWQPPPPSFLKVNVDGAHNNQSGASTCGGIIRDSNGSFVKDSSVAWDPALLFWLNCMLFSMV